MNRIYQGKVTQVEIPDAAIKGDWLLFHGDTDEARRLTGRIPELRQQVEAEITARAGGSVEEQKRRPKSAELSAYEKLRAEQRQQWQDALWQHHQLCGNEIQIGGVRPNQVLRSRLRLLTTFHPPFERHCRHSKGEDAHNRRGGVNHSAVRVKALRRAELSRESSNLSSLTHHARAGLRTNLQLFDLPLERAWERFCLRSFSDSLNALPFLVKTLLQSPEHDAMLFAGMFGSQPDCHPDILDLDDIFLQYAATGRIDGLPIAKDFRDTGVAFLKIRRNRINYLLLVPFLEQEVCIVKLNLIVQMLPMALAA